MKIWILRKIRRIFVFFAISPLIQKKICRSTWKIIGGESFIHIKSLDTNASSFYSESAIDLLVYNQYLDSAQNSDTELLVETKEKEVVDKSEAEPSKPFKCSQCKYTTCRKGDLRHHINTHTDNKPFKCVRCNFRARRIYELASHKKSCQLNKFKCVEGCKKRFRTMNGLRSHKCPESEKQRKTIANYKIFDCTHCNYKTDTKRFLTLHLSSKHSYKKQFECDICGHTTKRKENLLPHIRNHKKLKFACPLCPKNSRYKYSSLDHRFHNAKGFMEESKLLKKETKNCVDLKEENSNSDSSVILLSDTESADPLFTEKPKEEELRKCKLCGFSFNVQDYNSHLLTHTNNDLFQCNRCSFTTRVEKDFVFHQKTCNQTYFECGSCARRFKSEAAKRAHQCRVKTNLNQENQVRKYEPKRYNHEFEENADKFDEFEVADLENPEMISKIFSCKTCAHTSTRKYPMQLHVLKHVDKRYYKCSRCSYTSKTQILMDRHQLSCSQKKLRCTVCLRRYHSKLGLKLHDCPGNRSKIPFDWKLNTNCFVKLQRIDENETSGQIYYEDPLQTSNFEDPLHVPVISSVFSMAHNLESEIFGQPKKEPGEVLESIIETDSFTVAVEPRESSTLYFHQINYNAFHAAPQIPNRSIHKCQICGYSSPNRSYLRIHQVVHSSARPFKCNLCKYTAKRKDHLVTHMKSHQRLK